MASRGYGACLRKRSFMAILPIAYEHSTCLPCELILGLNMAAISAYVVHPQMQQVDKAGLGGARRPISAVISVCFVAFACLGIAVNGKRAHREAAGLSGPGRSSDRLLGSSISSLGIPPPHGNSIYLFGLPSCDACNEAIAELPTVSPLPVHVIELSRPGDPRIPRGLRSIPYQSASFPITPTILAVNPTDIVVGEYGGWSGNTNWQKAFMSQVSSDQGNAAKKGSQNENKP